MRNGMQDRQWQIAAIALTTLACIASLSLMPNTNGLWPALSILPAWMVAAALMAAIFGFVKAARMRLDSPARALVAYLRDNRAHSLGVAAIMLLAGANMVGFMWVKPLLNYLVLFRADPMLADLDHMLFLGHEPWSVLSALAFPASGIIYHPVWFVLLIFALLMVASARPSPERSAVLLSYFVLWTLAGPLIHIALPAAGPIFYERMGYGPRFAALDSGAETTAVADYLWSIYASRSFGAGSGISAMPSMHVTMSSWTVVAFAIFARRWLWLAVFAWGVIFVLSIALGWHYAVDGLVGLAAALATYRALRAIFRSGAVRPELVLNAT